MTVWYQLSTIHNRRPVLRTVVLLALCVAFITTLFFADALRAAPNVTKTINFQGRLSASSGAVVPDGYYNIQFKIYQDGTGTTAGNPGGSLKWTESYVNNGGTGGVQVRNGFFSVGLGSINTFGTSVDWDQDTLWLSMNVAGSAAACTTFGTSPCVADGEMLTMKRITATPYSINSGAVGGKTANDLVQLGQGVQTDGTNGSSIFVNKTGTGNLVQLQSGGTDAYTINNTGSLTLGSAANQSISVATANTGAGKSLNVLAGTAASGSALAGGDLILQGGAGDGTADSGSIIVKANGTDTTGTFQVQNAGGDSILNVDTANSIVSVGTVKLASTVGVSPSVSLWEGGAVSGAAFNDGSSINLGTTFKSDVAGYVNGVSYYNPVDGNSGGAVTGKLWACNDINCSLASGGTELAAVTFPLDSSGGWKTATFSTPVYITSDTYYIVTSHSPTGTYYAASQYFSTDHHNTPLHAMGAGTTANGSFALGSDGFPTGSFNNTNYWVDVVFQQATDADQITTSKGLSITSGGAMSLGSNNQTLALQGSSVDISAANGGNVTIQGGNATVSNGNGGSILLSGGAGNGTGANGLVVLSTPAFSTTTNDANCYTGGAVVAASCTIATSTVNNSSATLIGFSVSGQTATLPDPAITTPGRILYVMAAGGSSDFILSLNGGGAGNEISMRQNLATTLLWNGTDWIAAGGSSATTLQDAYNNTPQNAGGDEVVVNNGSNTGGFTVRDSSTDPVNGSLFEVKNAASSKLFSVNSNNTQYATDGNASDAANFTNNWTGVGSASVARITSDGQEASDSVQISAGTAAGNGVKNKLALNPTTNTRYRVSVYAKLDSGTAFSDLQVRYSPDNGTTFVDCIDYNGQTVVSVGWTQITCNIDTANTTVTNPHVYFVQPTSAASARTYMLDVFSLTIAASTAPNVQIGSGVNSGSPTTLFTLDKAATAPTTDNNDDSLLGSMYYDTTLGKLQCFEADGWGECGSSPDIFVTISPEYSNAVKHTSDTGVLTSDICSDALNINDGSSSQPTICGTNETYNFYKWTTAEVTAQTNSIYVTYQLPSTFKKFVADSSSLMGRTDSADSAVSYQIYRNNATSGLTTCGSSVAVSTGVQTSWQTALATGGADPSACSFAAGDSIVFRVNLTAESNANAYVSSLNFIYSNN